LFLLVQEGRVELIGLHAALYTGLLADYLRQDLQFTPHVTLGRFTQQPNKYQQAFEDASRLSLDYECVVDRLHLVKIDEQPLQIVASKEFLLQAIPGLSITHD
jgi:2'-5' RNA ligase